MTTISFSEVAFLDGATTIQPVIRQSVIKAAFFRVKFSRQGIIIPKVNTTTAAINKSAAIASIIFPSFFE